MGQFRCSRGQGGYIDLFRRSRLGWALFWLLWWPRHFRSSALSKFIGYFRTIAHLTGNRKNLRLVLYYGLCVLGEGGPSNLSEAVRQCDLDQGFAMREGVPSSHGEVGVGRQRDVAQGRALRECSTSNPGEVGRQPLVVLTRRALAQSPFVPPPRVRCTNSTRQGLSVRRQQGNDQTPFLAWSTWPLQVPQPLRRQA